MLNNINLVGVGHINVYMVICEFEDIYECFIDYKKAIDFYDSVKLQCPNHNVYLTQLEQKVIKS